MIVIATFKMGLMFFLYSYIKNNHEVLISFGFDHESNFVSLMIFFKLYEVMLFILNILTNKFIRYVEYQADSYASNLKPH
jgi:Zn-dependent protease with chaperone function